jgi:pyruvate-ferredoxin/flavodoxin oxidoreductase
VGWLGRWWRRSAGGPGSPADGEVLESVERVLAAAEVLMCEGIVHRPGQLRSAPEDLLPPSNAFGRPVREELSRGPAGGVAVATGMALAGVRATAFLAGEELVSAHRPLSAAADRLAPLVVHAANGDAGHAAYHSVSDAGCFQLLATSGQEALDLTLVARWLAERALLPGLVATDGAAIESLRALDEEIVRSYLGAPDEPIASPTDAQRILFGNERRRLLAWFDPERPVATGALRGPREAARAGLGKRLYFRDPLADLARQGMQELARLTGRPLSFVHRHRLDDAELVLVAQGALAQAARATADALRRERGWKVGVLGVTWLRPLPVRELVEALEGRRAVAVLEAVGRSPATAPPLLGELKAALPAGNGWLSATCAGPHVDPQRLVGVCEALRRPERPRAIDMERAEIPQNTGFPRRDALLQSLANAYPELRPQALAAVEPACLDPEGGRSLGLAACETELPPDATERLAEIVSAEAGPVVRGGVTRPIPGACQVRLCAAPVDFANPGTAAPVSVLLVVASEPRDLGNPLAALSPRGSVVIASELAPESLWPTLPPAWRREVCQRDLEVLVVGAEFEAGLAAVGAYLRGEVAALLEQGGARALAWRDLPAPDVSEREPPRVLRRIDRVRTAHDSLPRFWGEVLQPLQAGAADGVPDPLTASGAVPAGASALEPEPAAALLPAFDAGACTGCGRCWTVCPDAAIGATVLGCASLLDTASRLAGAEGRAADAVRRAHKHLAGRVAGDAAKGAARELGEAGWREAWAWLAGRMGLSDEDRAEHDTAFEATLGVASRLPLAVTDRFFHEPEQREKGAGELLTLVVDARACLGCGLCVVACPEEALMPAPRSAERVSESEARWQTWEELPDTAGATLAKAASDPELGALAGALLSRHCAQAQVGSAGAEPGSGERLAARLVTALVEQHAQQHIAALLEDFDSRRTALEAALREEVGEGLANAAPDLLAEALAPLRSGRGRLGELAERLESLGAPARFDRRRALRLAQWVGELDDLRQRIAVGEEGWGRARFGVVVARGRVAEWAARFPQHPYFAPVTLAPTDEGVELARGIAGGLRVQHMALVRSLRRAALEAKPPPDRPVRLAAIERLTWADLDAAERATCPPLLLLGDEAAFLEQGLAAFANLLASDLPVKVVLLDGGGRLEAAPEPALVAMAQRRAFVASGSLAHPEHLARAVADALAWSGPALLHLHAPSPRRHGFAPDATLERARRAVEGRAHVLFRYDPAAEGSFGLRASLEGNPNLDGDWGDTSFAEWAAGEGRFAEHFRPHEGAAGVPLAEWLSLADGARRDRVPVVEMDGEVFAVGERMARAAGERLAVWNTLRELTGAGGGLADKIRATLEREIDADHQARLEAVKAEYEARLTEFGTGADREAVARLAERFMALAGYAPAKPEAGSNGA